MNTLLPFQSGACPIPDRLRRIPDIVDRRRMPRELVASTLREELARVIHGEAPVGYVRDEIVTSWRASVAMGLRPERFDLPYDGDVDEQSNFSRAARPVVDRLGSDLRGTEINVVLSDERTRVIARRAPAENERLLDDLKLAPGFGWRIEDAGTNALGMASTARIPMLVDGQEHYMEALTVITTATAPVRDPRTTQVLGAVTLACGAWATNALLLPVARRTAREIEQRLLDPCSARGRLLDEHFLRARRHTRGPLALVTEDTLLTNAAGARMFAPGDQARLWDVALRALSVGHGTDDVSVRSDSAVLVASIEPVRYGTEVAGALMRFRSSPADPHARDVRARKRQSCPTYGWASLTESQRSLSDLVAEGLTNKEAAARLFVSHHTIDAHMRQIFRKLDIKSRVELARVVAARAHGDAGGTAARVVA